MPLRLKRIYEPPGPEDGQRFLVERLWPRGVKREDAQIAGWLKQLAPSPELRRWYRHDPALWDEFRRRYELELRAPERQALVQQLADDARDAVVTLVFAAADRERNGAVVLKDAIERLAGGFDEEWLFREIVTKSADAIIFADREGYIRLWNSGAEAIFGYPASEALGQKLDLIIPARQRERHWEGYYRVMAEGSTRYSRDLLAVPAMRKDGERISIEFTIVLVKAAVSEVLGAAASIRDVTARWQEQREMREKLAALQAQVDAR